MDKEEFDLNFGGWSRYSCPECKINRRLCVHLSHRDVKKKIRYFCKWCERKFEFKRSLVDGGFLRLYNGEIRIAHNLFRKPSIGVID